MAVPYPREQPLAKQSLKLLDLTTGGGMLLLSAQPNRTLNKGKAKSEQAHKLELSLWEINYLTISKKTPN
jgi:hypothetical protein